MECHEVDILPNLIVSVAWLDHEPGRQAICLAMDLPFQGHRPLPGQIRAVASTALAVASFSFDQVLRRSTPPISPPDAYTCLRASPLRIKSREQENKAIVGRWFKEFWGNPWNLKVVDNLVAPDILLQYSLHAPRRGRDDVRAFMIAFREAFPTSASRELPTSSSRATLWSAAGKAAVPTRDRRSATSSPGRCPRAPADGSVQRSDRAACRERQDRGRDWPGRWCDRAAAARPAPRGLTEHRATAAGDPLAVVSRQEDAA